MVWDREGAIHAGGGRPSEELAAFCGELRVGWLILEPADPESKGALERSHRFMRTNFEPGRSFANELDYQVQLDAWTERANKRIHRTLRCRPLDRLAVEREHMRPQTTRRPPDRLWNPTSRSLLPARVEPKWKLWKRRELRRGEPGRPSADELDELTR